eukprot:Blabericola_migrator_1__2891@NODE_182_length_11861_cov_167_496185_g158_i0_p2_GENE_NODE_182_length_11861_cov_167_496185_g158_i0NODE_182_length_11861_cov_167_496185_g158_i0_p2_ORF_typecomplete_len565_score71_08Amino_oxidase/PF01593_24/7_8e25NAD_binding_8/PF13450_6/8_2e11DAO/PF01266_24/8_4e06Pyr_redox_3/PF13738_6/0_00012Pyr_redox_3/PF13738_6/9_1e03Pyr_redox_2/PF07992_14/0_0017Pyr_redox_2/PF07992_14/1_1e02Thi4/PF01946_17/0_00088FMOlike/PF00743_19/0_004FMOlike/PF00743_19/3_6e03FMOlike/PF00743_19/6_9e
MPAADQSPESPESLTSPKFGTESQATSITASPLIASPVSSNPRIIIIGGGPCGIGAAVRLQELGYNNWKLYERANHWGGLSASIRDEQGFLWDIGGHVVFSHYQYFDDVCAKLGPPEYNSMKRKCILFMEKGKCIINYPLQNHIHQLPDRHQLSCLTGLLEAHYASLVAKKNGENKLTDPEARKQMSFKDWGHAVLGEGIVDVFLRPYNEKLWSWPLEVMSSTWLGERVAVPDFGMVLNKFETGGADVAWGPNSEFVYPSTGGTGAIWAHVGGHLDPNRAILGLGVSSIDATNRIVTLDDGTVDEYDVIINTVCLPVLASKMLTNVSEQEAQSLVDLTHSLRYNHVAVIGIGLKGPRPAILDEFSWSYFPQPDAPMFRVTALSNYSSAMCPPGDNYFSLLCEVGFSDWKKRTTSIQGVVAEVEASLRSYGLIKSDVEVVSRWAEEFEYGYPTPTLDRDEILQPIHQQLALYGILSRGRFGGWRYEAGNMDHSLMQGVEAVDAILSSCTSLKLPFRNQDTYFNVNKVNDPKNRSKVCLTNVEDCFLTPPPTRKAATTTVPQYLQV